VKKGPKGKKEILSRPVAIRMDADLLRRVNLATEKFPFGNKSRTATLRRLLDSALRSRGL
jgi:hypothetical protein